MNKHTVKSKSFRAYADPESKVLKIYNRKAMEEFLNTLNGEVEFHITEVDNRTHWQNNYYHSGVIGRSGREGTLLDSETFGGYTSDEMHEALKQRFKIISTKLLTVAEFSEYIEQIVRWAALEYQVSIKPPYGEE